MKASSTWALSEPVWVHWAMKRVFDRLAIIFMVQIDSGIVMVAIRASCHEITYIMISVPAMVSSDVSIWLSVCWRLWAMLSMSLVTRLSRSPRGCLST